MARADWYACRGRWQECARDHLARLESHPREPCLVGMDAAAALILAGDLDEYRKLCARLAGRFRGTNDAGEAAAITQIGLLLSGSLDAGKLPLQTLDRALQQGEAAYPWLTAVRGLAAFRAGDYPLAVQWSRRSRQLKKNGKSTALALLVRSMAEHQLHPEDKFAGCRSYAEATDLVPDELQTLGTPAFREQVPVAATIVQRDWLIAEILRREAEQLLFPKLALFLKGKYQPRDKERLALAVACRARSLRRHAARLYRDALAADPRLAEDLKAGYRYSAACCAARIGSGAGRGQMDDQEKELWRQQALRWLRDDLAAHARRLETGTRSDKTDVQRKLQQWQSDPELGGVRIPEALARLPAEERPLWTKLWAEVEVLAAKARAAAVWR